MTNTLKQWVEDIANQKAPGPSTTFTVSHIFFALELMAEKPLGRNKLAKKLDVGEGAIRTIINRLKDAGLITTSKEGCTLTNKGLHIWKEFAEYFPERAEIGKTELTNAEHNYAFLIKNSGHKVKSGIEQRDAAIMAGAKRAVVIVYKDQHLTIDSVSSNIAKEFPEATRQILQTIHPKDNDVIIIVSAANPNKAKHGAFAASWSLLETG